MNDTQIKTRHGLILQGVTGEALSKAGFKFVVDEQYDPTCEKPDFLIPDGNSPHFMLEVHQTDVRNSLAMKILRAFTAVMECKAHYGPDLVTINLIFGLPNQDFSSSPMSALGAIYDFSYLPCQDESTSKAMSEIEKASLELASNEEYTTEEAISEICKKKIKEIKKFGKALNYVIGNAKTRKDLIQLWQFEQKRQSRIKVPPIAGFPTYHKRQMLYAMYFSDNDFDSLIKGVTGGEWKKSCVKQLIRVGLGEIVEEIEGDRIDVSPDFELFLTQPNTLKHRKLCAKALKNIPDMHWYFEDIRNISRREAMVKLFLNSVRKGKKNFKHDLTLNTLNNTFNGVEHSRTWYADFTSIYCDMGFNSLNRLIYQDPRYSLNLWSPFNNLALKWSAHERNEDYVNTISDIISDVVFDKKYSSRKNEKDIHSHLVQGLLDFRVRSSIKLRKLNPLVIVTESICKSLGLTMKRTQIETLLSDLAANSRVGQMLVFAIRSDKTGKRILASIVAVHDKHGDDKSKEWGARRLSTLYRMTDSEIQNSEYKDSIFVIDGDWADKDVARLYRSGWNYIVRLDDLEDKLREIFDLPAIEQAIEIPEVELPLAAEKDSDDMNFYEG